ncbi:MAB_1171c family putative transporter [Streptomyces sp. NPDC050703]|uniref:MAB_1171c family putative transporter n=1 Tax=Streptomyces sp. NPDC050703 TaxID=3157218 RepID=UPI0034482103
MYDFVASCLYLVIAALWFTVGGFKAQAWRRQQAPALLAMAIASVATAVSFLCSVPVVADAINEKSGVSFLGLLFVYLGRILFSAGAVVLVLLWAPPSQGSDSRRAWTVPYSAVQSEVRSKVLLVYGPVMVAMTTLFAFFPSGLDSDEPLDTTYADRPTVFAYLLVYQAGFGWALCQLGMISWSYSADPANCGLLGRSLRRITIGCALIGGYVLSKIAVIVAAAAGTNALDWVGSLVSPLSGCVGCLVLASGWVGAAAVTWRERRSHYRALRPLWTAALQVDGRLALDTLPRPWAEWLVARDLEWRITRRTREIRDGQLALRPWVPADVVETAQRRAAQHDGLDGPREREAAVAAAAFAGGLRALRAGERPAQHCERTPGIDVEPGEERQHLVLVAGHLKGPFVAGVLADTA